MKTVSQAALAHGRKYETPKKPPFTQRSARWFFDGLNMMADSRLVRRPVHRMNCLHEEGGILCDGRLI